MQNLFAIEIFTKSRAFVHYWLPLVVDNRFQNRGSERYSDR